MEEEKREALFSSVSTTVKLMFKQRILMIGVRLG
jgi:hypothetical protein